VKDQNCNKDNSNKML